MIAMSQEQRFLYLRRPTPDPIDASRADRPCSSGFELSLRSINNANKNAPALMKDGAIFSRTCDGRDKPTFSLCTLAVGPACLRYTQ